MSEPMREAYEAMMKAYEAVKDGLQETILAYLMEHRGEKVRYHDLYAHLCASLDILEGLSDTFKRDFDRVLSAMIDKKLVLGLWESRNEQPWALLIPARDTIHSVRLWATDVFAEKHFMQLRQYFGARGYHVARIGAPIFCDTTAELYIDGRRAIINNEDGSNEIGRFVASLQS